MMTYREYKDCIHRDKERYGKNTSLWKLFLMNCCYRITVRYRICKLLEGRKIAKPLWYLARYIYSHTCMKHGCDIPSHVQIGPGFRMDHPNGIVINSKARIGSNFTIKSGAVIGANDKGIPVIGDNVLVGVHALIIGKVFIDDNSRIGAGAIVTHDVPKGAVVVCDAARVRRIEE